MSEGDVKACRFPVPTKLVSRAGAVMSATSDEFPVPVAESALARLEAGLDRCVADGLIPGFVGLVARRDAVHVHIGGVRDLETAVPMTRDTIFAVASIAKPLTAVAALMLVEDGTIGLDDPVDPWLPELADRRVIRALDADLGDTVPAERPITVRDLLTMRMGLGAVFSDPSRSPLLRRMHELGVAPGPRLFDGTEDELMRRLGELPLVDHPGRRWLYHTGLDVAGVLIARAGGMPLGEFQRRRIFEPLGMKDTGFHVPSDRAQRLATIYMRDEAGDRLTPWRPASGDSFLAPPRFESGGGGLVSTVSDFLAFGRMLLDAGRGGRGRLLSPGMVAEMLRDQITPAQKAASTFFPDFWKTFGWGLGLAVAKAPDDVSPVPGRFGWWGGFGTTFFVDPHTETVAILFTQRMMGAADDTAMSGEFLRLAFEATGQGEL